MFTSRTRHFCKGLALVSVLFSCSAVANNPTHGIATHGNLKYPEGFTHFDYVNPDAQKGGEVALGSLGGFDSFNPYIIKGSPAPGAGMLHCSLMQESGDEPSSLYGYLATKIEVPETRDSVTFTLNPEAQFSDGSPVTAEDVLFSFNALINKGAPLFSLYYRDVTDAKVLDNHKIQFNFKDGTNRELPMILGQMPVFSKAYFEKNKFEAADLTVPIGCGPYEVAKVAPGSTVKYKRKENWWGQKVPSQVGMYNFDITYKNFRDQTVWFEAFKSGEYDFRSENIAKNWANGYKFPAVRQGKVIVEEVAHNLPVGMQSFAMNIRKPLFEDNRVREALNYAFDFEWANENLFHSSYGRTQSYFENSDLAAKGALDDDEFKYLANFRNKDGVPDKLFSEAYSNPASDGTGNNRKNIKKADKLLRQAGWVVKNGKRVNEKTGMPFQFEFMTADPAYERIALAYKRNLDRLGIDMNIRTVNPSQYIERVESHDFDMILHGIPQSETPGNEQRDYWGSDKADVKGSRNVAGIKNPVLDEIIEDIIDAQTREDLKVRTNALDRILLWNHYMIPGWYLGKSRVAYWDKFQMPEVKPKDGIGFVTWWIDPTKEKALNN
jgi:microcin C transport system substrate-binding protein